MQGAFGVVGCLGRCFVVFCYDLAASSPPPWFHGCQVSRSTAIPNLCPHHT
jgi:hypothetical protein